MKIRETGQCKERWGIFSDEGALIECHASLTEARSRVHWCELEHEVETRDVAQGVGSQAMQNLVKAFGGKAHPFTECYNELVPEVGDVAAKRICGRMKAIIGH